MLISSYRICRDISCAAWIIGPISRSIKNAMHEPCPPAKELGAKGVASVPFSRLRQRFPSRGRAFPNLQDPADFEFKTTTTGVHSHALPFETDATRGVFDEQPNTVAYPGSGQRTAREGDHHHEVLGGNLETRPVNAYVHWIIRAA